MPKPSAGIFAPVLSVYLVARVATVRTQNWLLQAARAENTGFPNSDARKEFVEIKAIACGVDFIWLLREDDGCSKSTFWSLSRLLLFLKGYV